MTPKRRFTPRTNLGPKRNSDTSPARKPASAPFRGTRVTTPASSVRKGASAPYRKPTTITATPFVVIKKKSVKPKPPRVVKISYEKKDPTESWNSVSSWYEKHLESENTYHEKVILPNLIRLVTPKRNENIVDLACGTGYFTSAFAKEGAVMTGIDVSEDLIAIARKNSPQISYHVGSAEDATIVSDDSKDRVTIVLAIQNIEHTQKVLSEVHRILKIGGTLHIVMNHPAFRIPKRSFWGYDDKKHVQYRRTDEYLSESKSAIEMNPGKINSAETISYHRPLQYYFKALAKAGFLVERLEEWTSHKDSDSGPRAKAENHARKEIPLFLYLGAKKLS